MRKYVIIALLLTLGLVLNTYAEDCVRVRTVYPTYNCTTPYVAPYVAPYAAPVTTYYPVKDQVVFVPKAIEVEVHRNHYYSIDQYYQQSLLADAVVGRLLAIQFKSGITNSAPTNSAPTYNQPTYIPPTNGTPAVNNVPTTSGPIPVGVSNFQNPELAGAFKNSCIKCHDGKQRTALLTSDDRLLDLPKSKVLEVYHLVNTGKMPKGDKALDDKFMPLIDQWVGASK